MVPGVYDDAYNEALRLRDERTIHLSTRLTMKM